MPITMTDLIFFENWSKSFQNSSSFKLLCKFWEITWKKSIAESFFRYPKMMCMWVHYLHTNAYLEKECISYHKLKRLLFVKHKSTFLFLVTKFLLVSGIMRKVSSEKIKNITLKNVLRKRVTREKSPLSKSWRLKTQIFWITHDSSIAYDDSSILGVHHWI